MAKTKTETRVDHRKRKDAKKGPTKKQPKKQPKKQTTTRISAWKELVSILATRRYIDKITIISKLKALGYEFDVDTVSYVMTAVRKNGQLCVYTKDNGYTAIPDGRESLFDIRKRRRISAAWLRNARPLVEYVNDNMAVLTATMTQTDVSELKRELDYHSAVLKSLESIRTRNGLE